MQYTEIRILPPPPGERYEPRAPTPLEVLASAFAPLLERGPAEMARDLGRAFVAEHIHDILGSAAERRAFFVDVAHLARVAGAAGADAIDVACGDGVRALALAALGASRVTAFDADPARLRTLERLASILGLADRVEPRLADFAATPIPCGTAAAVVADDALSRAPDLDALLGAAARALAPAGRLCVRELRNRLHPAVYFGRQLHALLCELWGPPDGRPYVEVRRTLIGAAYPELPRRALRRLARKTRGLAGEDVLRAAHDLARDGRTRLRARRPVVDPLTGLRPARGLSAFEVARAVRRAGLRPTIAPPFDPDSPLGGRARRAARRALAAIGRAVPVHAIACREVIVVGRKPAAPTPSAAPPPRSAPPPPPP